MGESTIQKTQQLRHEKSHEIKGERKMKTDKKFPEGFYSHIEKAREVLNQVRPKKENPEPIIDEYGQERKSYVPNGSELKSIPKPVMSKTERSHPTQYKHYLNHKERIKDKLNQQMVKVRGEYNNNISEIVAAYREIFKR